MPRRREYHGSCVCVPPGGTPEGILDVAEYIVCVELFFFLFVLVLLLYPTGARRENDSNGHRDGKERLLVREKGRSRDTLFRKRSRCKRGVFFLFVLSPLVFFLFESFRGHLSSSTATRKEEETLTTAKIESLSRKNAEITRRRARDEETLTAKVVADLSRKNEKMTPRRSARRASFSEIINDNVKDVRATRVKEIGDVEGSLLVVPTNDEYMGKYMLESGKVWEEHVLSRMLDYVRVNSNVVDVGANYGSYSVYFSKKVGRGGTVTSQQQQQQHKREGRLDRCDRVREREREKKRKRRSAQPFRKCRPRSPPAA